MWKDDISYQNALKKIRNLKITNDVAERAVALANKCSGKRTKNEDQFQSLVQTIHSNRKKLPTCKKKNFLDLINN